MDQRKVMLADEKLEKVSGGLAPCRVRAKRPLIRCPKCNSYNIEELPPPKEALAEARKLHCNACFYEWEKESDR
jgi:hypothetical protein